MADHFPSKIMHVDDDKTMRSLVGESIEREKQGVLLISCKNGQEAANQFNNIKPQLILLDLAMPDMDGPDTLLRFHNMSAAQNVPVIFLTGKTQLKMQDEYKALGVLGVIHKPFSPKDLVENIGTLWQEYLANRKKK